MPLDCEEIVDGSVGGDEALGLALRFEALHLSLSSPHRKVRVFRPVVISQSAGTMTPAASQLLERSAVRKQTIGHEPIRNITLPFQQLSQQSEGCVFVAALLNEDVQDLAFVVYCTPHEHAFAVDPDDHLIEMPDGARAGSADIGGNGPAELLGPAPHRFVGDVDPPFGQNLLDVSQTERKFEVQPDRLADHFWREPVSLVGYLSHLAPFIGDKLPLD